MAGSQGNSRRSNAQENRKIIFHLEIFLHIRYDSSVGFYYALTDAHGMPRSAVSGPDPDREVRQRGE